MTTPNIIFRSELVKERLQVLTRALDFHPEKNGRLVLLNAKSEVLAVLQFPRPSLEKIEGSILTLQQPAPTLILATGEVTQGRFENGSGDVLADVSIGVVGSGAAIELKSNNDSLILFAGGELSVSVAQLKEG